MTTIFNFKTDDGWHWVEEHRTVDQVAGPFTTEEECNASAIAWSIKMYGGEPDILPLP